MLFELRLVASHKPVRRASYEHSGYGKDLDCAHPAHFPVSVSPKDADSDQ
jgi:hypothetical protein